MPLAGDALRRAGEASILRGSEDVDACGDVWTLADGILIRLTDEGLELVRYTMPAPILGLGRGCDESVMDEGDVGGGEESDGVTPLVSGVFVSVRC